MTLGSEIFLRLIGFEELGNNDNFDTAVLELRLLNAGLSAPFVETIFVTLSIGAIEVPDRNTLNPVYKVMSSSRDNDEVFDLDD